MGEDILFHEEVHKITSRQILHYKVQVVIILEGTLEPNHPWIFFRYGEDISLLAGLHDLVLEDHLALLELLDCDWIVGLVPLAEPDLPKGALADDLDGLEVEYGYLLALLP